MKCLFCQISIYIFFSSKKGSKGAKQSQTSSNRIKQSQMRPNGATQLKTGPNSAKLDQLGLNMANLDWEKTKTVMDLIYESLYDEKLKLNKLGWAGPYPSSKFSKFQQSSNLLDLLYFRSKKSTIQDLLLPKIFLIQKDFRLDLIQIDLTCLRN